LISAYMKRSGIVVYSPGRPKNDVSSEIFSALGKYFRSDIGGAWAPSELTMLLCPSAEDVTELARSASNADYCFAYILSPAQRRREDRPWQQLFFTIGEKELCESDINVGSRRFALVVDASIDDIARIEPLPTFQLSVPAEIPRTAFEAALGQAEEGLTRVLVPPSSDWATGGFTGALLARVNTWAQRNTGVFTFDDAFGGRTNIIYEGGRRLRHFPFAVQEG
jgi:hypothetical protein